MNTKLKEIGDIMFFIKIFIISVLAGKTLSLIHFPIPWLLGPALVVQFCRNILHLPVVMQRKVRNGGLIILGYIMGRSFTKEIALQIVRQLPIITVVTILTIIFCIILALLIYKPMKISPASAILGSVPGGMTQMVILCDDIREADITIVTFMQTMRFISVVIVVPFIVMNGLAPSIPPSSFSGFAGGLVLSEVIPKLLLCFGAAILSGLLAEKYKLPTPYLVGPVLAVSIISVIGISIPEMPRLVMILAQVSIGIYIGTNISTESLKGLRRLFIITSGTSLLLIGFTFLTSLVLTRFFEMQLITAFLSTAPGGISEMAVTALAVNADLSFITAFQMFRFMFILFIVPPILRWFLLKTNKVKSSGVS